MDVDAQEFATNGKPVKGFWRKRGVETQFQSCYIRNKKTRTVKYSMFWSSSLTTHTVVYGVYVL